TEEYTDKHSDLIFKTKIDGSNAYIYTILEHQSTNDRHMGIRLLEYNTSLIRQHMKEKKTTKAPIILNILIYAGKKPYTGPHNLLEIFEKPELAKDLMFRKIHVIDLQSNKEEEITKDEKAAFVELLLKYGILRDFIKLFENQIEILKPIISQIPYLDRAISYIFLVDNGKNKEKLLNLLKEATQNEEKVMSLAQQFENEGRKKGIKEGMQKEKAIVAKNMLKYGATLDFVKKTTGLTKKDIETISKKK
ncbi:MAG: Rpn family recombination-promoting nuclease/putative transposase, partial [Bacteroidetes bacterium]|nr:Rpn family recombination-promoting nuclease/putative transposase [Bacteroidota bacterium]